MSFVFEKTTVKKWEVTGVYKGYMKYDDLLENQMPKLKCEICGKRIEQNEMVNLAYVKGRKNHFVCDSCTEVAAANGVEMQYKKSEPAMPKFD